MNGNVIGTTQTSTASVLTGFRPGQETSEVERESAPDLPPSKKVPSVSRTDRVEISDAGKAMAVMSDQSSDKGELQLSPERLREMAST